MKAVVWDGSDQLKFDPNYPDPSCKEDWVVVKVMSAGICATDLHIMNGEFGPPPLIMGHEICGRITQTGSMVTSCAAGDRVVVEPAISCGHCEYCRSGNKHLCRRFREIGQPPVNGGYAQYVTVPAGCIHQIPDAISWDEGGIFEALLCAFGMVYRYGVRSGETVLIQGTGAAGLSFLQSVKIHGAGRVIMAARNPYRLRQALRFGADVLINTEKEDLIERVRQETDGLGVGLSIDAAGTRETVEKAVRAARPGGRVMLYGLPEGGAVPVSVKDIIMKQLTVYGATNNELAWDPLIKLVSQGRIDVRSMITGTCTLEKVNEAITEMRARPNHLIKTVIHPWE